MKRVDVIERKNANLWVAILIGLVCTLLIAWGTLRYLDLSFVSYLTEKTIVEILLIIPTVFFTFIIHECIHVVFFYLFGKGKAKIKVSREKSIGAVIMHQVNEDVFYSKGQMIVILLSPLVFLTIGLLFLNTWIGVPFLLWINIVLNALGSTTDIYLCYQLIMKYQGRILVNFDSSEVKMNVYVKQNKK